MGCCLTGRPHLEDPSPLTKDNAVSGPSLEYAGLGQGVEEILEPGPVPSNDFPSSSGPENEDGDGETEGEGQYVLDLGQSEDFPGIAVYLSGNGETESGKPGPGVGQSGDLPSGTPLGFAAQQTNNEEVHEEGVDHSASKPEDLPSHSDSAPHADKKVETKFRPQSQCQIGPVGEKNRSLPVQYPASCITDEDRWAFSVYLLDCFEESGKLADLQRAITILEELVRSTPASDSRYHEKLTNLGVALRYRFDRLGELNDLKDAISRQRHAIDLIPHGHPDKAARMNNLGSSFRAQFERLGELNDLEEAISVLADAVDLTPDSHPHKPGRLTNLGNSLLIRFKRLGELSDLEDALSWHRNAVDLTPYGHPQRLGRLNNLSNSFQARFEHLGELGDLDVAISTLRDAIEVAPDGYPHKLGLLNSLANSLFTRFEYIGELSDLEDAISRHEDAVSLTPPGHPLTPQLLNCLANSLFIRFERLGKLSDLEVAISMLRDAIRLTPRAHPLKFNLLNSLGNCFLTRFEHLREHDDIESAISSHGDAVDLVPPGHLDKPTYLNNLGLSLLTRFEHLEVLRDLEDAISTLRDAINLVPDGRLEKARGLSHLGCCLIARFHHLEQPSDLENAILMLRDAVDLTPHGHSEKPGRLSNLGNFLFARFRRLRELRDLEEAISILGNAVDLLPRDHPNKPAFLSHLGNALFTRFECLEKSSDLEDAICLYSRAASAPIGSSTIRFYASQQWISCARRIPHHSLLHAYSVSISLLPQLAWIGLSLSHRYSELMRGADVVREAAAAALDSGLSQIAVEWLEQGRSIIWGELLELRSPYEELLSTRPDHARRLRELSVALEHAGAAREKSLSSGSEQSRVGTNHAVESLQQEADRHRMLAIERDKLLQEIRTFPGLEQFLLHREFSQLRAAAHSGPVAILNAAESRCDALIVVADMDQVVHVALPAFTFKRSLDAKNVLKSLLAQARAICSSDREGKGVPRDNIGWESLLSTLWKCAVRPVLEALNFSTPGDLSRIFWCPTGPFMFLPIHAAGFYDPEYSQPGHKVFDFVVSSYVPTLSILLPNSAWVSSGDLRLLFVRRPISDGLSRLPGVATELEHVREIIKHSPSACATLLESNVGTVEEVLELMKGADWVHFACHGVQDDVNSGLCLADGRRLKLRDIIALSRPYSGLAFLSACQTATGEEALSEEAIHIAAGMLFAGYGGVVGTMWSISDKLAPDVARDVYQYLFRDDHARPDHRDAARALHEAIGCLRDGNASYDEWLPFIHMGL